MRQAHRALSRAGRESGGPFVPSFKAPRRNGASKRRRTEDRVHTPRMSSDVQAIEDRVQVLSADDLLERYHELVDQRFVATLPLAESYELQRIEARLSLQDATEIDRTATLQKEWRRDRDELVRSIEDLLARFKTAS